MMVYRCSHVPVGTPPRTARFEYLAEWDPTSLIFHHSKKGDLCLEWKGNLCVHVAVKMKSYGAACFAMVLQAGLKRYPNELGYLVS